MSVAIANHNGTSHRNYPHKMLILGDMLELGEWSHEEHLSVLGEALGGDAERVLLVGSNFLATSEVSDQRIVRFATAEELKEWLLENPIDGAFVLVKGSRGVGLERVLVVL